MSRAERTTGSVRRERDTDAVFSEQSSSLDPELLAHPNGPQAKLKRLGSLALGCVIGIAGAALAESQVLGGNAQTLPGRCIELGMVGLAGLVGARAMWPELSHGVHQP